MTDSLAIAAVTSMLQSLLENGLKEDDALSGIRVTARPLDKARDPVHTHQVNLFLYHMMTNDAWRNRDVPWQVKSGETGRTPLALDLYYLVTAYYGEEEDGTDTTVDPNRLLGSHRLLGRAMGILHDNAVLGAENINSLLPPQDRLEHPYDQVEHVRIRPQPLSLDEVSKLWSSFQTEYRTSAAYQVSVVLIESTHPARTPLPVLRRGEADRGVHTVPLLSPILRQVRPPGSKPSAELGDRLTVVGENLGAAGMMVRVRHPQLDDPIELAPDSRGSATELGVQLPAVTDSEVPANWPAGIYTLSLLVQRPELPPWTTNEVPFALAPQVEVTSPVTRQAPQGNVSLELDCLPQVRSEQRVALLFGDREIGVDSVVTPTAPDLPSALTFQVSSAQPGEYVLRVRVDGVDSIPVDFESTPPQFDDEQKVTITL
jgi:hypothetical protein